MGAVFLNDRTGKLYRFNTAGDEPDAKESAAMQRYMDRVNAAIPAPPQPASGGIGQYMAEVGKSALAGLGHVGTDTLRTVGGIGDYLAGNEEPGLLNRVGKQAGQGLDLMFAPAQGYEDSSARMIGGLAGTLGGFMVPGSIAGKTLGAGATAEEIAAAAASASRARIAGEAALGAGIGGGEAQNRMDQYEESKGVKLDPDTRAMSTLLGSALGTTFAFPVERLAKPLAQLLRFVPKDAASTVGQTIAERLKDAAVTGGVAGAQNVIYGVGQDLVEKGLYNPDIDPADSIMGDLTVGGGVGALMHFALGRAYNKKLTPYKDLKNTIDAENAQQAELQKEKAQQGKNFATGLSEVWTPELGAAHEKATRDYTAGLANAMPDIQRAQSLGKPGASEPRRPYIQPTESGGFRAYTEGDRSLGQESSTLEGAVRQMDNYVQQLKSKADAEAAKNAPKYPSDPAEPRTRAERIAEIDDQIAAARKENADLKKTIRKARGTPGDVELGSQAQARVDRLVNDKRLMEEVHANQPIDQASYLKLERPESGDILGYIRRRRMYGGHPDVDGPIHQTEMTEAYAAVNPKDNAPESYTNQVIDDIDMRRKQDYLARKEPAPTPEAKEPVATAEPLQGTAEPLLPKSDLKQEPKPAFTPGEKVRLQSGNIAEIAAVRPNGDLRLKNAISDITPERVQKIEAPTEAPKVEPKTERKPFTMEDVGLRTHTPEMFDKLQQRLHGYGLKSVALKLRNWIEKQSGQLAEGAMHGSDGIPKIIELATSVYKKGMSDEELLSALARTLDHEAFHAIAGVLEPHEVKALEKFVLRQKMPGKTYTYVQYHQAKAPDGAKVSDVMEEAMADAFRDWAAGDLKISGEPRSIMARIFGMFKRIGEWWTGAQGAREVFERLKSGELGKRVEEGQVARKGRVSTEEVSAGIKSILSGEPQTKYSTKGRWDDPSKIRQRYMLLYRDATGKGGSPEMRQRVLHEALWHDMKLVRSAGAEYRAAYNDLLNVEEAMMNAAYHSTDGTVPSGLWDALREKYEAATQAKDRALFDTIDLHAEERDRTPEYEDLRKNFQSLLSNIIDTPRTPSNILNNVNDALSELRSTFTKPQAPTTPSKPTFTIIDGGKKDDPKYSSIGGDGSNDNKTQWEERYDNAKDWQARDRVKAADEHIQKLHRDRDWGGASRHAATIINYLSSRHEQLNKRANELADGVVSLFKARRGNMPLLKAQRMKAEEAAWVANDTLVLLKFFPWELGNKELLSRLVEKAESLPSAEDKLHELYHKKYSTIGADGTYDKAPVTPDQFRISTGMRVARAVDPITRIRSVEHAAVYNAVHDYLFKPGHRLAEGLRAKLNGTTADYALADEKAEYRATRFISLFVDRMITLAKMVDYVKKNGGTVDALYDAYALNDLIHGKVYNETGMSERLLYDPMKKAMFEMGFKKSHVSELSGLSEDAKTYLGNVEDPNNAMLGLYLYARHAPERNAAMKEMNPSGKQALDAEGRPIDGKFWSSDRLSGMSDNDAAIIMNYFRRQPNYNKLARSAELVDDIIKDMNQRRRDAGLIPEEFDYKEDEGFGKVFKSANVRDRDGKLGYANWVPLRGFSEDMDWVDTAPAHGRGFQSLKREDPRALGRGSMAAKIVENVIAMHEKSITRAARNKVGEAFLTMVEKNADILKDMAVKLEGAPLRWALADGNFRVKGQGPDGKVEFESKSGLHGRLMVDPLFMNREGSPYFLVKRKAADGRSEHVIIDIKNPQLARAMKGEIGMKSETAFAIINHIGKFTRLMANLATSWNPEFLFMNMQRDIAAAGINLNQFELDGVSSGMARNIAPSMRALYLMTPKAQVGYVTGAKQAEHFIRDDIPKLPPQYRDIATRAMDFIEDGGSVEFQGIKELADITSHINDGLRDPASFSTLEKTKKTVGRVGDFIESYNKIAENSTRLAVYSALRDALEKKGMTSSEARLHAARAAKNMTANFNRGGELKPLINALYMFYNASIQGSFALAHGLITSKKVQAIAGSVFLAGAAQDAMMSMLSPEDENGRKVYDNIPEWALETRMIFIDPFGVVPKGYLAIPMPHGFSAIFNAGRSVMRGARGSYSPGEAANSMFGSVLNQFDPIGGTNSWLNFVAPTVLDPVVDLSQNRDYKGDPIAKTPSAYGVQAPQSQLHWNNTSPAAQSIAEWMNYLTGGDSGISGAIDISPDQIDYVAGYLTGGAGRFIGRLETGAEKALSGNLDDLTVSDIPIARALVGGVSDRSTTEQYIAARQEVLQPAKAIKDAAEAGDARTAAKLRQAYGDRLRLMGVFQAVDSTRNKLSNRLRQIQNNVNIPEERKSALVHQIKLQMREQENRALRAYNGE